MTKMNDFLYKFWYGIENMLVKCRCENQLTDFGLLGNFNFYEIIHLSMVRFEINGPFDNIVGKKRRWVWIESVCQSRNSECHAAPLPFRFDCSKRIRHFFSFFFFVCFIFVYICIIPTTTTMNVTTQQKKRFKLNLIKNDEAITHICKQRRG